jgi:hypothetical protein
VRAPAAPVPAPVPAASPGAAQCSSTHDADPVGELAIVDTQLATTLARAWERMTATLPARVITGVEDPGARPD